MGSDNRTCQDINECEENGISCGTRRMCFNRLGDYTCIDTPCPVSYKADPRTGQCIRECTGSDCVNRPMSVIEYRTLALPKGIKAGEDLIRLMAYTQDGRKHPDTRFYIIKGHGQLKIPFSIRYSQTMASKF